ncbi:hypothetical protein FRC03_004092 [Tulasnella sp. 419]|nr:hypothetical protein FRC03_004092 [Tulasnella sp. 419]
MPRKPVNARLHPLALPSVETSHRIPNSSPPVHQPPHVVSAVESTNALSQRPPSRQMLTSSIRSPPLAHLRSLRLAGSTLGVKPLERPSLLEGVARTTLPLSSIIKEQLDAENAHNAFSILPSLSQPGRSSLDSLRSLHLQARTTPLLDNSAHSAPSSPSPQVSGFEYFNPSNWWFNHKSEVDQLLHSDDQAPTVEEEEQKIRKRYKAPKNPVVFCHGLLGFDSISLGPSIAPFQISHWKGIKEVMQSNGVEVLITRVPATSSPEERAKVLADTIAATYGGRSVHLIGHSMV